MDTNLLNHKISKLRQRLGANVVAIDAIKNWLATSDTFQRVRINPYQVGEHSGLGLDAIVPEFLYGVTAGLFDMHWDIHCPHCNMITAEFNNLADTSGDCFCKICEFNFDADFSERVKVTFSLSKEIEDLNIIPNCDYPAELNPKFNMLVNFNQTEFVVDTLTTGRYRYFCPITLSKGILVVEGEPTKPEELESIQIKQLSGRDFDKKEIVVRPGKIKLELTNLGHAISGIYVIDDNLLDNLPLDKIPPRLSGLQLIHFPAYKRLFGNQVLSEREQIKIRAVTVIFTDITGSTRMYEQLGDAKAYNLVRDHFDIFFKAINHHCGTEIKTIGDAIMASFITNKQALEAVTEALINIKEYNRHREDTEKVKVKVGMHRGSAVLVNLNNRLDYFGRTINKAARIQNLSKSDQLSFSEDVYNDEEFLSTLKYNGWLVFQKTYEDLKGIEGQQVVYKAKLLEGS